MKHKMMMAVFALATVTFTSCNSTKEKVEESTEMEQSITVTGEVTHIENGKDGYMATIKNTDGKEYIATISIVNLQKSGSTFKRYEVGDTATVTGMPWSNDEAQQYNTATAVE